MIEKTDSVEYNINDKTKPVVPNLTKCPTKQDGESTRNYMYRLLDWFFYRKCGAAGFVRKYDFQVRFDNWWYNTSKFIATYFHRKHCKKCKQYDVGLFAYIAEIINNNRKGI